MSIHHIKVHEILKDISCDATDEFLMKKYGISEKGLQTLFQKLLDTKALTQAELDRRASAVEEVEAVVIEAEDQDHVGNASQSQHQPWTGPCSPESLPENENREVKLGAVIQDHLDADAQLRNGTLSKTKKAYEPLANWVVQTSVNKHEVKERLPVGPASTSGQTSSNALATPADPPFLDPPSRSTVPEADSKEQEWLGKVWRCPSCHMPQTEKHAECPQCGITVEKYLEVKEKERKEKEHIKELEKRRAKFIGVSISVSGTLVVGCIIFGLLFHRQLVLVDLLDLLRVVIFIFLIFFTIIFLQQMYSVFCSIRNQPTARESRYLDRTWSPGIICGEVFACLYIIVRTNPPHTGMVLLAVALMCSTLACRGLAKKKGYDPGWGVVAGIMLPFGPLVLMFYPYSPNAIINMAKLGCISYETVYEKILDPLSTLTSAQRSEEWRKYKGRIVEGHGKIFDIPSKWFLEVEVEMEKGPNVIMHCHSQSRATTVLLGKGEKVRFIGRLARRGIMTDKSRAIRLTEAVVEKLIA